MGAWDYGLLDNDCSQGIMAIWKKEIKRHLVEYPDWGSKEIIDFYLENHFDGKFDCGDYYINNEILSLTVLLVDNGFDLTDSFKDTVENVISFELQRQNLKEWKNPEKRKHVLLTLLEKIEGEIKKEISFSFSALEFPNKKILFDKISLWIDSDDELEKDDSKFLDVLWKVFTSRLGYDYDKLYTEGTQQRMMLIAFFLGRWLKLPKEDILKLVRKAKNEIYF